MKFGNHWVKDSVTDTVGIAMFLFWSLNSKVGSNLHTLTLDVLNI